MSRGKRYELKDVPTDAWAAFTGRAIEQGWPVRALLLQLMRDYGHGQIMLSAPAPPHKSAFAWLMVPYRAVAGIPEFAAASEGGQWLRLSEHIKRQNPARQQDVDAIPVERRRELLAWLRSTAVSDLEGSDTSLILRAIAHFDGQDQSIGRRVIQYEVLGLPPDQKAFIVHMVGGWRILRIRVNGEQLASWGGAYRTAVDAQAALQEAISVERST